MEEQSKEWEIDEHRPFHRSDETNRGKVSWALEKGIGFGKRLLFTGLVISSAPLALPPLLVVSAIGLVVSIPSGMFLASYFCSENLMRKLLPIPDDGEREEQEESEHRGLKRKIEAEESEDGNVDDEKEEEVVAVLMVDESGDSGSVEGPVIVEEIVVEEVAEPENGDGQVVVEVTTVVVEEREHGGEESEIKEETKASLEKIRDEGKEDNASQETPTSKGDQSAVSSTTTKDDQSAVSTTKDNQSTIGAGKDDQRAIGTAKDDQSADKTTKDDQTAVTTASELPISQGTEETKDQAEVSSEQPVQTTPSNSEAKKKKNVKKKPASQQPQPQPQKVMYDEEKMWEQIEGVRKILGYRVKAQKSTTDELKALYVFTGVEPPASVREPSDLADVNRNLQILKSIIGVN